MTDLKKAKRIQKRRQILKQRFGNRKTTNYVPSDRLLLSNLVYCRKCGGRFVGTGGGRWRCGNHVLRGTCENKKGYQNLILEKPIYEAINRVFYGFLIIDKFRIKLVARIEQMGRLAKHGSAAQQAELKCLQARKANILSALEEGRDSQTLLERILELEQKEKHLLKEVGHQSLKLQIDDLNLPELFHDTLRKLPLIIHERPYGEPAKKAIRAALTNTPDWWEYKI